jgi:hypothetical protein
MQGLRHEVALRRRLRSAGARIIATEFLYQLFGTAHHAITAFNLGFGWEAFPTFTTDLESN